jgi:hypothetical protein
MMRGQLLDLGLTAVGVVSDMFVGAAPTHYQTCNQQLAAFLVLSVCS